MDTIARGRIVLMGAFAALTVVLLFWILATERFETPSDRVDAEAGNTGTSGVDAGPDPITIEGDVVELMSPGAIRSLDLAFTNPNDTPISVSGLVVTVQNISAPNASETHPCTAGDFQVDQPSAELVFTIAAGETHTLSGLGHPEALWPRVGMLNRSVNQDGCKGAVLTFDYAASGVLQ